MKARWTNFNSALTFEIESDGVKGVFKELALLQEVFDTERKCGRCGGDYRCQFRQVDDFDFFEFICLNSECRARFSFGQAKKGGGLFPKRKDEDGKWIENGGWVKYQKAGEETHNPDQAPAAPPARQQAPATTERPLPDQLKMFYDRIEKNRAMFPQACTAICDQMIERAGAAGHSVYGRIADSVATRWPKGIREMSDIRIVLLELWDAYEALKH